MELDWENIEQIFMDLELSNPETSDAPDIAFFDHRTGSIVRPQDDQELIDCEGNPNLHAFPRAGRDSIDRFEHMLNFADTIEDGGLRITFDQLLRGRGAMRRFRQFLHRPENVQTLQDWNAFMSQQRRIEIRDWFDSLDICGADIETMIKHLPT